MKSTNSGDGISSSLPYVNGAGRKILKLLKTQRWPGVKPQGTYLKAGKYGVGWTGGRDLAKNGYITSGGERIWREQGQWTEAALEYASKKSLELKPGQGRPFPLPAELGAVVFKAHKGERVPATQMFLMLKGMGNSVVFHGYPKP